MKYMMKQVQYIAPQHHKFFVKQYKFDDQPHSYQAFLIDMQDYAFLLQIGNQKVNQLLQNTIVNKAISQVFSQFLSINQQFRSKIIKDVNRIIEMYTKEYKKIAERSIHLDKPFCTCQHENNKEKLNCQKRFMKLQDLKDLYNFYNVDLLNTSNTSFMKNYSQWLLKKQQKQLSFTYTPIISTISMEEYEQRLNYLGTQIYTKNLSLQKVLKDFVTIEHKLINDDFIPGIQEEELLNYQRIAKGQMQNQKLINLIKVLVRRYLRIKHQNRKNMQVQVNIKESNVIKQLQSQKRQLKTQLSTIRKQLQSLQQSIKHKDIQIQNLNTLTEQKSLQYLQKQKQFINKSNQQLYQIQQLYSKCQFLNKENQNMVKYNQLLNRQCEKFKNKMLGLVQLNKQLKDNWAAKLEKQNNKNKRSKEKQIGRNPLLKLANKQLTVISQQKRYDHDLNDYNGHLDEIKQKESALPQLEHTKSMGALDQKNQQKHLKNKLFESISINHIDEQSQVTKIQQDMNHIKKSIKKFKTLNSNKIIKKFIGAVQLTNNSSINLTKESQISMNNIMVDKHNDNNLHHLQQTRNQLLQKLFQIESPLQCNSILYNYQDFIGLYKEFIHKLTTGIIRAHPNSKEQSIKQLQRRSSIKSSKLLESIKEKSKSRSNSKFKRQERNTVLSSPKHNQETILSQKLNSRKSTLPDKERILSKFYKNKGSNNENEKSSFKSENISRQQKIQKKGSYLIQKSRKHTFRQIQQTITSSLLNSVDQKETKTIQSSKLNALSIDNNINNIVQCQKGDDQVPLQLKLLNEIFQFNGNAQNVKNTETKSVILVLTLRQNQYILEILSYLAYLHANVHHQYTQILKLVNRHYKPRPHQQDSQQLKIIFHKMIIAHRNCNNIQHNKLCPHLHNFISEMLKIIDHHRMTLKQSEQCLKKAQDDDSGDILRSKDKFEVKSQ